MSWQIDGSKPLRYRISDWRQLSKCKSNNSRELHIVTTTFFNDDRLNGLRIKVEHDTFGTLFACVTNAKGTLICPYGEDQSFEFTPNQILSELAKYGFFIEYHPTRHLEGKQISFLITMSRLGYDKLRMLVVHDGAKITHHVVLFNAATHDKWLNNAYSASKEEFTNALLDGSASNISDKDEFDWSWLNFVANIDDIIRENS